MDRRVCTPLWSHHILAEYTSLLYNQVFSLIFWYMGVGINGKQVYNYYHSGKMIISDTKESQESDDEPTTPCEPD